MSILGMAANFGKSTKPLPDTRDEVWIRPEPGHIKLNVDSSFHSDMRAGSAGAILRDYNGRFVAASTTYIPHVTTAPMAEAIAMREGLTLAIKLGCQ
jgi:hypothetical protein